MACRCNPSSWPSNYARLIAPGLGSASGTWNHKTLRRLKIISDPCFLSDAYPYNSRESEQIKAIHDKRDDEPFLASYFRTRLA